MRILGLTSLVLAAGLAMAGPVQAQNTAVPATAELAEIAAPPVTTTPTGEVAAAPAKPADPTLNPDGSHKTGPVAGIGQPVDEHIGIQEQVTPNGVDARYFHDVILVPLIAAISLFVLGLLLWVMMRYRRKANPTPSRTAHNTLIEIVWTLLPVLILVAIAIPSIKLLAAQFKPPPENAITLKAIGKQWVWAYEYPDNDVKIIASNMLKEPRSSDPAMAVFEQAQPGERARTEVDGPRLLAVDNRVVLPVGVPIRLITTADDVIHSWAVPALWIKLDAVPGKLNEASFLIKEPGLYFGQCSELCGQRHGYMPIAIEAVSPEVFAQWIRSQGGKMPGDAPAEGAAANAAAPATDNQAATAGNAGH